MIVSRDAVELILAIAAIQLIVSISAIHYGWKREALINDWKRACRSGRWAIRKPAHIDRIIPGVAVGEDRLHQAGVEFKVTAHHVRRGRARRRHERCLIDDDL